MERGREKDIGLDGGGSFFFEEADDICKWSCFAVLPVCPVYNDEVGRGVKKKGRRRRGRGKTGNEGCSRCAPGWWMQSRGDEV
jgi:hypothetical protein